MELNSFGGSLPRAQGVQLHEGHSHYSRCTAHLSHSLAYLCFLEYIAGVQEVLLYRLRMIVGGSSISIYSVFKFPVWSLVSSDKITRIANITKDIEHMQRSRSCHLSCLETEFGVSNPLRSCLQDTLLTQDTLTMWPLTKSLFPSPIYSIVFL